jgi:transposase
VQQYVAFDVSKQSSEAVIVDEAGNRLVSRKVATDPLAMAAFVAKHGTNVALVGFEAGPLSTWLYHELKGAGLPVVCIDSWRARAALSARLNKTDRTDAAGLADLLRAGFHHPVYVKSYAAHEVRTMLKARDSLVAQRRTLQNTIRGLLETFGLVLGKGAGGRFAVLVEDALASRPSLRRSIEPLLRSGRPPARPPPRCIASCGRWPGPMPTAAG